MDWIDNPVLSYKLVCDGNDPLTNRAVLTRRPHDCDICRDEIPAGVRVRRETRRSGDGLRIETRYVCVTCAAAIEKWARGDDSAINARHDIGRRASP